MEGRKEGEGAGRRGRRHEAEVTSVVAYKAPSAVQGEREKGRENSNYRPPKKAWGPTLFTLDFSPLHIFLNNLARLINQGLEISQRARARNTYSL